MDGERGHLAVVRVDAHLLFVHRSISSRTILAPSTIASQLADARRRAAGTSSRSRARGSAARADVRERARGSGRRPPPPSRPRGRPGRARRARSSCRGSCSSTARSSRGCAASIEIWSTAQSFELGQERVAGRLVVDDARRSRSRCAARSSPSIPSSARSIAGERVLARRSGRACRYGSSIWTTSAPAAYRSRSLLVDRRRRRPAPALGVVPVVVVLRLLGHRERARAR